MARRRKPKKRLRAPFDRELSIELEAFEIVRGYDGPLRGMPELALVLGAYRVTDGAAELLGRGLAVEALWGELPLVLTLDPSRRMLVRARARLEETDRLAILGIAIEHDSGADIQELYGALPQVGEWRLWEGDATVPSPATLDEVIRRVPLASTCPVHAIVRGQDVAHSCRKDDLIGVTLAVRTARRGREDLRLPFASADGKNDWTARLSLRVR